MWQLVGFRGCCPFKQYISNKPAEYRIKIWTFYDTDMSKVLKSQVYAGRKSDEPRENHVGMWVVMDLLKSQNVTCDNFLHFIGWVKSCTEETVHW